MRIHCSGAPYTSLATVVSDLVWKSETTYSAAQLSSALSTAWPLCNFLIAEAHTALVERLAKPQFVLHSVDLGRPLITAIMGLFRLCAHATLKGPGSSLIVLN